METPESITRHFFELIKEQLNLPNVQLKTGFYGGFYNGGSSKYVPKNQTIIIDLDECRTVRDIIYVVGHELFHAKQNQENPEIINIGLKGNLNTFKAYRSLPREIEADNYGIHLTRTLKYKNKIINPNTTSLFIWTMKHRPHETHKQKTYNE